MKTTYTPRLTAGIHSDSADGGGFRRRRRSDGEPVILDRLFPRDRRGLWWGLCGLVALAAVIGVTVVVLRGTGTRPGEGGGMPGGISTGTVSDTAGDAGTGTYGEEPTDGPATTESEPSGEGTGTVPSDGNETAADPPNTGEGDTTAEDPDHRPGVTPGDGLGGSESDTTGSPSGPSASETDSAGGTEEPAEPELDTRPPLDGPSVPAVPEGCYPIIPVDVSEQDRGSGYIAGNLTGIPDTLPRVGLWETEGTPTVLIVNTHPYEGYGDGKGWYDPEAGALALTDTPNDSDGTVALGAALARALRGMGVTVIHLRIAVSEEDSAADIYDRTESVVRSYCRLYPDIGLILDLRRSAEMTAEGGILRTEGTLGGEACAQLRVSVSGGREDAVLGRDLAVAVALREGMWGADPSISRPVRVKSGAGIVGELTTVRVLTLELGAAGNTFAEAERLISPLAAVLSDLVLNFE